MELTRHPLTGRIKIFTDEKNITRENIVQVLYKAYAVHRINVAEMQFLIDYEAGVQPLPYTKEVRPEVDVRTTDNMANYVTEFHKGYFWGNPPVYTQRGNKEHHNTDEDADSTGISALNEMMLNGVCIGEQNQILSDFVEKVGVGYRFIDPKSDWDEEEKQKTYVNVCTLDPRYAFCVYYNGIGQPMVMGVTFVKTSKKIVFTCFTDTERFEISSHKIEGTVEPNPCGKIPIVEHLRAIDRTGCFERQISMMDNLNTLVSCTANDAIQRTQEIWWGNDIDFPKDEKGNIIKPESGQWLLTYTGGEGNNPKIQAMSSSFDTTQTQDSIDSLRNEILKKCFVPMQYDSSGGGSTGIATNSASGWSATETFSMSKEQLERGAVRKELELILRAIKLVPSRILPANDQLREVHSTDVDIKFTRIKNWDLASKANSFATLVSHGVNGRQALKVADMFDDVEQVWLDSKEGIEKYQEYTYNKEETTDDSRIMQDSSDQAANSPFVDGMQTNNNQLME